MISESKMLTPSKSNPATNGMSISPRVCLAAIGTVRAMHGCTAEKVFEFVEAGRYVFVWDFSHGNGCRRNPRFWFDELADAKAVRKMSLDAVIDCILPHNRAWFAPGDVCRRFVLHRSGLLHLRRALGLPTGNVPRSPLAEFLRRRWIGRLQ